MRLFSNLTATPGLNKAAMTKTTIDHKAGNIIEHIWHFYKEKT